MSDIEKLNPKTVEEWVDFQDGGSWNEDLEIAQKIADVANAVSTWNDCNWSERCVRKSVAALPLIKEMLMSKKYDQALALLRETEKAIYKIWREK